MDWKYKHFHQERVFAESSEVVTEAARKFMAESLSWKVTNTSDGLTAEGYSFTHRGIANFHIQPTAGGTKVAIELLVARAGWRGYMLFDVGGYFTIQLRKWLDGIQWELQQKLAGTRDESTNPLVLAQNTTSAHLFNGCLVVICVMFAFYLLVTVISALVGLLTGTLFLFGRGGSITVHGMWARIVSAGILLAGAYIVSQMIGKKRRTLT
ncbi:MAG TPA: hypothetical protein VLL54_02060 [Pyrinomonadaceae bacterium]|nr:hypothetical protein [Pyrinomonadaceae bacterium]